jgi:5'-phosphate synthase pdxT subunit
MCPIARARVNEERVVKVGVVAVQGASREHLQALRRLEVEAMGVRTPEEVAASDAVIIPGGESTTIGKLMARYGLLEAVKEHAVSGKPLLGTCAGMILMAKHIEAAAKDQPRLDLMDITVERNAFGRQVDSFETDIDFRGVNSGRVRAVFIRAPVIQCVGEGVDVLAVHEGRIIAARQGSLLVLAFHPELTDDLRIHRYFLSMVGAAA